MSAYSGRRPTANRSGDVAGTLRLLAYLAAAIALMVLDHRGGWLRQVRAQGEVVMQPVWWLAGLPGRIGDSARGTARTHGSLTEENRMLRNALLVSGAQVARLRGAEEDNQRIRALLGAARRGRLDVQLVSILDIDLDPSRQRLVLDGGSRDGVRMGQPVIDAGGVVGQVIALTPTTSTALLLTDPGHALPVEVARSGVRLVAYGRGDGIALGNVARTADIRVGDVVQTSGLGGRFPPGFKVGTVEALRPDDSRAFLTGALLPAAGLDRGREVLLLRQVRKPLPVAPVAEEAAIGTNQASSSTMAQPASSAATNPAAQDSRGAGDVASPTPQANPTITPPSPSPATEPAR